MRCVSGPKLVLDRGDPFAVKCDQPARLGVAEAQVLRAVGPAVALAGTSPRCPILVRRREALTYSLGPGLPGIVGAALPRTARKLISARSSDRGKSGLCATLRSSRA